MSNENGSVPPTGNPAPGAPSGGGSDAPWYSGIADEGLRGYVQNKGFKDPTALADSYRNLEKLVGVPQERLLKLPEKGDDPAWGEVYGRLGRPDQPSGYELKHDGDAAFAERFAGVFHAAGLTKGQASALNEAWNGYVTELIETDTREREQKDAVEMTALKAKWGQQYDANAELARRAGQEFGLSEDDFKAVSAALGSGKTLELFQRIGAKAAEPGDFNPGTGSTSSFGMTPETARARIEQLKGDKDWTTRYMNGGAAERSEFERLHQVAYSGSGA